MIHTSFCTIAFQKNKWGKDRSVEMPLEEILPVLGNAGYDAVEIWWPHLEDALTRSDATGLADLLSAQGLHVSLVSPYFDFTSSDDSAEQSIELGGKVAEAAGSLGARGVRCFTGKVGSEEAAPAQWDRCVESLQRLADSHDDLLWLLETHPRNLMDTIESTRTLLQRCDRKNIGIIYQPSTFAETYMQALRELAPWIHHVHATNKSDNRGALLGQGDMDWPAILDGLREIDFDGCVCIEWMGDDPAAVAAAEAEYLRGL
ncbi:MAG: sugar phosphate isomerase/epimerase family protein, partial [Phycisphaerae bacterium]